MPEFGIWRYADNAFYVSDIPKALPNLLLAAPPPAEQDTPSNAMEGKMARLEVLTPEAEDKTISLLEKAQTLRKLTKLR